MTRIIVAFLAAPLPAALIQALSVALWPKRGMGVFEHPQSMFVLMCLIFYAAEVLFAVPLYVIMRNRLPERMLTFGAVGALIMLLPASAGLLLTGASTHLSGYVVTYDLLLFAVGGFFGGLIFWRITKPRNTVTGLNETFA